mmetsp:Transcript_7810/g.8599  ORF Transcript_7810/g.8599 Transcript_7810/m.8599 type:complete len:479 (+) Transcript_7810:191-1627(+)
MTPRTKPQIIAISITPMISGVLSFISSSTILVMILRSETKLNKPHRRLIFAMSFYDVLKSLTVIASRYPVPAGTSMWAFGNSGTCSAQGFLNQVGSTGSPFYSFSLAILYLCIIKYDMREITFRKKFEPFIHVIPNLWVWSTAIFLGVSGYMNNNGNGCWIAPYPINCIDNPDVDCIRGENAIVYKWIFAGVPVLICFVGSVIIMVLICTTVLNQHRTRRHSNSSRVPVRSTISQQQASSETPRSNNRISARFLRLFSSNETVYQPKSPASFASGLSLGQARNRNKEVVQQALLFIAAFLGSNLFTYINNIVFQVTGETPYWLAFIARTVNGLQGLFNVLVFTRPHIISLRRKHKSYSWLKAFWTIVKSGGDHDGNTRRRGKRTARRLSWISRQKPKMPANRRLSWIAKQKPTGLSPTPHVSYDTAISGLEAPSPQDESVVARLMDPETTGGGDDDGYDSEEDMKEVMKAIEMMENTV